MSTPQRCRSGNGWDTHPHPRLYARLARALSIPEPPEDAPFASEHLRARRLALGLTQKEAADRIGVGRDVISRWELGRTRPGQDLLAHVGMVLGVDLSKDNSHVN